MVRIRANGLDVWNFSLGGVGDLGIWNLRESTNFKYVQSVVPMVNKMAKIGLWRNYLTWKLELDIYIFQGKTYLLAYGHERSKAPPASGLMYQRRRIPLGHQSCWLRPLLVSRRPPGRRFDHSADINSIHQLPLLPSLEQQCINNSVIIWAITQKCQQSNICHVFFVFNFFFRS